MYNLIWFLKGERNKMPGVVDPSCEIDDLLHDKWCPEETVQFNEEPKATHTIGSLRGPGNEHKAGTVQFIFW